MPKMTEVKNGNKTEEEVYTEFVDTFQMNHDNRVGPRNKRVSYDEFLDYYNFVSMGIDDDSYFVERSKMNGKLTLSIVKSVIHKMKTIYKKMK